MAKQIENEVEYYYDLHPTREDLMGESFIHRTLVQYLMELLQWLFHGQRCAIYANLNFYQTSDYMEYPLAPDIAVIKGVDVQSVRSWRIGRTGPPPHVVFEIGSKETWQHDIDKKPMQYARMGVQEYFAYDPTEHLLRKGTQQRLFGWQLDPTRKEMREMPLRPDGTLWSVHLNSFLVPDGEYLRLHDQDGNRRLTQLEFEKQRADAQAEARRREAERADAAAMRAEEERRRAEALADKLRSLGIDPDQI